MAKEEEKQQMKWMRDKLKKSLFPTITISFVISGSVYADSVVDSDVLVKVGGQQLHCEQPPVIVKGTTLVPLRTLFEAMGASVNWDSSTRTVTATKSDTTVRLSIGKSIAYKNKDEMKLDVPGTIIHGTTMVPTRFIAESFGSKVNWDAVTRTVNIDMPQLTNKLNPIEEKKEIKTMNNAVDKTVNKEPNVVADKTVNKEPIIIAEKTVNKELNSATEKKAMSATSIMGDPISKPEELYAFAITYNPQIPRELAELYVELGRVYHIRGDIAFIQMCKETNFFRFGGDVKPEQNNLAGIGTTGNGEKGYHFANLKEGIQAHLQHLYAYATRDPLASSEQLMDPRFKLVKRGIAPTWEQLGGRWAVSARYGEEIVSLYQRMTHLRSI
jgi:hypothetical protein